MEGKDRLIYIYGINPVQEAFKVKDALKEIYISKKRVSGLKNIMALADENSIPVKIVDDSFIDNIAKGVHQGVLAKVKPKKTINLQEALSIPDKRNEPAFFLILDLIEDPQNFGAILRTADAAGVHAVVYQKRRSAGVVPSVWKASSGAVWHVNLVEINNIKYAIRALKDNGIKIIGAEAKGKNLLWETDLTQPVALIIGSEGGGIRQSVLSFCEDVVSIPMKGMVNSLNVSVATALFVYEVIRQRSYFTKSSLKIL